MFNPRKGSEIKVSGSVAGLGGDNFFYKVRGRVSWFYPIVGDLVVNLRGNIGVARGYNDKEVPLLEKLYPLHRTLASDGTDEALKIVGEHMPAGSNYKIETYIPGTSVWTWSVPERFVVYEAYLETESGERVVDFAENLLHIVSYSLPIDAILTWEELEPHLYYNEKRPWATPWIFKFYERPSKKAV